MRGTRRVARRLVVGALALGMLAPVPAHAYHRDRQAELERLIQEKREQIREATAREHDLESKIAASDARRAQLESELRAIESDLSQARARLSVVEERLDAVTADLRAKTAQLELTLARLEEHEAIFRDRVAHMYIMKPAGILVTLAATESFPDFIAASEYVSEVVQNDAAVLDRLEQTKASIETQRADIERRKASLAEDRAAAAEEAQRIASIHTARASVRDQINRELVTKRYLLTRVRDRKAAYRRALRSYENESSSITAFLQGAQSGQRAIQGRGGWLKWPVSGRITSDYGWRRHPIYGYRSFHTGIDIASPSGTAVKSARRGTVLSTGYRGAYGLTVLIDHGSAVATLYAHLSRVYVRAGEHVDTLESVAAVGSTGWSTGPHLHFEVRVDGQHTDPNRWL